MAKIYIIKGDRIPELRIGVTNNLEKEIKKLNRTKTFVTFSACAVYDMGEEIDEDYFRKIVEPLDKNSDPEGSKHKIDYYEDDKVGLYDIPLENAYGILLRIAKITGTIDRIHKTFPDGRIDRNADLGLEELDLPRSKRKQKKIPGKSDGHKIRAGFSFAEVGIPEGSELHYKKDPTITAVVVKGNNIKCGEIEGSLSAVTLKLLGKGTSCRGPEFWTYGDGHETLRQLRDRLESENDAD